MINDIEPRLRLTRRTLLATAGGSAVLLAIPAAIALAHDDDDHDDRDDDDRDNSGPGNAEDRDDHDDHDNSGPGNAEDRPDRDDDDDDDDDDFDDEGDVAAQGTVPPGSVEVRIVDDDTNGFQPGPITIDPGQQVTFVNLDDDPHTATGAGFDTGIMQPGQQVTITFDEPGTFPYSCQIHPVMTGVVEVRGEVAATSASPEASPAAATPAAAGGEAAVTIVDFSFDPAEIEVAVGTTVTWTNEDSVPHTATAEDGTFDTGALNQGESGSHTFDTPGEYPYICSFHPNMHGVVIVT
ncbi:MAG TPA: cupredoxin domain-containing protein [Thermomicrobiales bacterium]|nr:cupredoxin domain-containing protein [Thermomicrobiales bacterium]